MEKASGKRDIDHHAKDWYLSRISDSTARQVNIPDRHLKKGEGLHKLEFKIPMSNSPEERSPKEKST